MRDYELTVQIWEESEDGPVYYSVIQEVDGEDEVLRYGEAGTFEAAADIVGQELKGLL